MILRVHYRGLSDDLRSLLLYDPVPVESRVVGNGFTVESYGIEGRSSTAQVNEAAFFQLNRMELIEPVDLGEPLPGLAEAA